MGDINRSTPQNGGLITPELSPAATTTEPTKRKISTVEDSHPSPEDREEAHPRDSGQDASNPPNCDEVREMIRNLVDSTDMRVCDFQKALSVSPSAYQNFMKQSGPERGSHCETYLRARDFFKSHPQPAVDVSSVQQAPQPQQQQQQQQQEQEQHPAKKAKVGDHGDEALDVGNIKLDGEDDGAVEVYDTCDEIRRKINTFLAKHEGQVTKAAFCRALSSSYPHKPDVPTRQLARFMDKKGPTSGNSNIVFYAAYVFFEKKRILEGKPKSKMRQEMEKVHPKGMNVTECMDNMYLIQGRGKRWVEDRYGRLSLKKVNSGVREGYKRMRRRPYKR
ncbi:hypothetical protein MGN70_012071 [Eutypa lata]|nr:hypothetical protein MGN70_012071 [Eutypa lata]